MPKRAVSFLAVVGAVVAVGGDGVRVAAIVAAAIAAATFLWVMLRRRAPRAGGRCPRESNKVVFASRADAQRSVERSRRRRSGGRFSTPLDHEYHCPHYDHWHVSSKPRRR